MSDDTTRLRRFPWATFGRPESPDDLFRKAAAQATRSPLMGYAPRFSVVVTVPPSAEGRALADLVASLRAQSYPHWELVVVAPRGLGNLGEPRARLVEADAEMSEAGRKNAGAREATGEWLLFLDADDLLNPSALYHMALPLQAEARPGLVYANETRLAPGGRTIAEFRSKPEPSVFDLLHFNYVGRPWAVETAAFRALNGFREAAGVHHEHDLFLRLLETEVPMAALPSFLAHRRRDWFPEADDTLRRLVQDHLERRGVPAEVTLTAQGGHRRVKVRPPGPEPAQGLVSAIICFRDKADWTVRCLEALGRRAGRLPVEVLLVDNGSAPAERDRVEAAARKSPLAVRVLHYDAPFNFARMHNWAIGGFAKGSYLFLLNNDVFLEGDWTVDELVAWAAVDWCGTVGIQLRYPHGAVQHGGLRARFGGEARLARVCHEVNDDRLTHESRETFANTFAACLFRRKLYDDIGGLRELDLPNGFGDVVFNFECLRRGLRNVYLGHLEGLHLESASRGNDYEYWEECIVENEYPEMLQRMLRRDLGVNRTPGADVTLKTFVRQAIHGTLEQAAPQLLPLKAKAKRTLLKWAQDVKRYPVPFRILRRTER